MVSAAVTAILGFVFWVIVARYYSPENVGLSSAAISAVNLLAMIASLGLGYGLIRFLPGSNKYAGDMINSCFNLGVIGSLITVAVFIAGINLWAPALVIIRDSPAYLTTFVLFVVIFTLSSLTEQVLIARRRGGLVLTRVLVFNILRIPLPIILVAYLPSLGIFSSWAIAMLAALLVGILFLLPRAQKGYRPAFIIKRNIIGEIIRFSFANYLSNLFWAVPGLVFPIMIVNVLGAEPNAYFYISWAIGNVIGAIPSATSTSLFAEGSNGEEELALNIKRSLKIISFLLIPTVIVVLIFGNKILLLFGTPYSENAVTLLRILTLSNLPLAVNVLYLAIKRVERDLGVIVMATLFMMLISLGLAALLIPDMGINGAGIGWLAGQTIIALMVIIKWLGRKNRY